MANELRNVNISFVSIVNAAANKKKFAIVKNEDGTETFDNFCPIIKQVEDKQEVTAIVYEPEVVDAHGDYMTAEEIEKAQRTHAMNGFGSDIQHSFSEDKKLHLVESWITKQDSKIGEQAVKKGTWMQTVFVEDNDLWSSIKKGEFTGFSMGGTGERIEKKENKKDDINNEEKTFFAKMLDFLKNNNIKKENKKEEFKMDEKKLQEMIDNSIKKALNPAPTVEEQVAKALEKAGVIKKEEEAKEPSEDEKISKAVEGVLKSLGLEQKEESFEDKVAKAVAKAIGPMSDKVEKMAAARGYTKTEEPVVKSQVNTNIKKSDDEIFDGIFVKGGQE